MIKPLVEQLYPLNRQINGSDTDKALEIIGEHIPNWEVHRYAPGTKCWTWDVPNRWMLKKAYLDVFDAIGWRPIVDTDHPSLGFPLSVVAYSQPFMDDHEPTELTWNELEPHLHFSEERPDAIPWVSTKDGWGFCIPKTVYDSLPRDATYRVLIDAEFTDEPMSVGVGGVGLGTRSSYYDFISVRPELLLCAHICHPMQANDDISGVAVLCDVARRLQERPLPDDAMGVRFLFCPETIGSTAYLSQNEWLIPHIKAGVFVEMAGTDESITIQSSWQRQNTIDDVAFHALKGDSIHWGEFGSVRANDEKVINGPGVDIPCISLMRWPYPEYHTSDDTPDIIHEDKLQEMADVVEEIVRIYCTNYTPKRTFKGYLNARKYGVYVDWTKEWDLNRAVDKITHLLEGDLSVFEISERVGLGYWETKEWIDKLKEKGLVERGL